MKLLSNRQKANLAQTCDHALKYQVAKGQLSSSIDPDVWRREEVERCTGKPGLRACSNSDYNRLLAHFESLAGEDGRALNALVREQSEPRRQAEAVLLRELSKAQLPLSYAEKIARDKFGCGVLDTDARQCWQLVYTIKNRLRARAQKAAVHSRPLASIRGSQPGTRNPEPGTVSLNSQPSTND